MEVIRETTDLLTELATVCKLETLDSIELKETLDVVIISLLLPKSGKSTGTSVP